MNVLSTISGYLTSIFLYIFKLTSYSFRRLKFVGQGVPLEDRIADFNAIFKTTLLFFIYNLLAFLIFTLLPQGKDIILIVIEDLSSGHIGSLISLLFGLVCWCIVSEFGARYKIYVTDNSGLSFTDERVNFRKEAQKLVSSIYLLLPVVIVMISVIIVSFNNIKSWGKNEIWPFTIVLVVLILVFAALSRYYLDRIYIAKLQQKKVFYKVDPVELKWANKLYGIYNDYVFLVRKSSNFKVRHYFDSEKNLVENPHLSMDIHDAYKKYENCILGLKNDDSLGKDSLQTFPRDYIKPDELPPILFEKVEYKPDNKKPIDNPDYLKNNKQEEFILVDNPDGYQRWIYKNNASFYKTLHKQVHIIAISSMIILLVMSLGYLISYEGFGSPGLVCLSLACWLGLYTGLLYIDSRFKRSFKISIRLLLFIWLLLVSAINRDHPVRKSQYTGNHDFRIKLSQHFDKWSKFYLKDDQRLYTVRRTDTSTTADTLFPVYFITAEGGALRTGAFAAELLAKLQDSFPQFKDRIYSYSSVSGGSVGLGLFNAVTYQEPIPKDVPKNYFQNITKTFFAQDQLSAPVAKLFYGDLLNIFWPQPIERFDRAIALEKAWEHSYSRIFGKPNDTNVFSSDFLLGYAKDTGNIKPQPAWFINTTESETGIQCYLSNVIADSILFATRRDLLHRKIGYGINYSTAINFSSRFPIFSPSAAVYQNDDQTYHYVDGGYVENTGSKTMYEVLQQLHDSIQAKKIIPYVIQLKFSDEDSARFPQSGFLNEVSSILLGIYNTRSGNSAIYTELLRREIDSLNGKVITVPLPASSSQVPMSWVFSKRSLDNLDKLVDTIMRDSQSVLRRQLPEFDTTLYKRWKQKL